jgi:SAM-dependent methyltransferase
MASFLEKSKKAIKRPKLVKVKAYDFLFGKLGLFQKNYSWRSINKHLGQRVYKDYSEYISHQKAKLQTMDLSDYDDKYYSILKTRLAPLVTQGILREGSVALCLAARIGTEVRAFKDLNCFAVGIDLNPGNDNRYVLPGDFHDIQFPQNSVDVIFTNSLDHSLYLDKLVKEIKRVLKREGHVVLEIVRGVDEGGKAGYYEAVAWSKVDDCLEFFINNGFKIVERNPFEYPWGGEQVILKIND